MSNNICSVFVPNLYFNLIPVHTLVAMEKTDLKEVFSKRYASYKVHTIQTSRLCTHMKGKSKKRNPQIYVVPASEISCYVKDGRSFLVSLDFPILQSWVKVWE